MRDISVEGVLLTGHLAKDSHLIFINFSLFRYINIMQNANLTLNYHVHTYAYFIKYDKQHRKCLLNVQAC